MFVKVFNLNILCFGVLGREFGIKSEFLPRIISILTEEMQTVISWPLATIG